MPRTRRVSPDNSIHHVLNRGNRREAIFRKKGDYESFLRLMGKAHRYGDVRILAFCLMPNHWHMVLWVVDGSALSAYVGWLANAHVRHHHQHYGTNGLGHVYQGRFKNFLIQGDAHLYTVLRYVEGNAMRAGLVERAEYWQWSSAGRSETDEGYVLLPEWPIPRPVNWLTYVNEGIPADELAALRHSTQRGAPFGDADWVAATATTYGLESTLRKPRGLPSLVRV